MASKMPSPLNKGSSRPNLVVHTGSTEPSQPQPQPQPQPPAPPSPVHEPLTWDMWWGRARHLCFGPKKAPNPTGVEARKDFGWLVLGGSLLCFVAGWVNAFAIIAASSTVTHVTGSTTKAGMALVEVDGGYIAFAFMIWLCFVLGGAVSGIIIVKDTFAMGRGYGHAFLLISMLLLVASVWVIHFPDNHGYLFLLAMGMGIQNGLTTRYSGNVVRTTHVTGLSTDIGITIGHVLRCHPKPDRWKLKMYCPMLICFFLGAAAGKSAFDRHGRSSLLLPTFFLFMMGWTYIYYLSRIRRQPFQRVLLKRVSDEIMTPHSPSHKHKQQHKNRLGLLHLPQIHIPFKQHAHHHQQPQQPQQQQQQQGARAAYHSRRHSSACDQLGKSKENTGDVDKGERAIVLDIGAPAEAPTAGSTTGDEDRNELSNHMAAIV